MTYEVVDGQTGAVVSRCKSAQRARNRRDRLDSEYGAVRYFVRLVQESKS